MLNKCQQLIILICMIKARVCWLTSLGKLLDSGFSSRETVLIYSSTFKEVMYFRGECLTCSQEHTVNGASKYERNIVEPAPITNCPMPGRLACLGDKVVLGWGLWELWINKSPGARTERPEKKKKIHKEIDQCLQWGPHVRVKTPLCLLKSSLEHI